jgi:hypothetical protein
MLWRRLICDMFSLLEASNEGINCILSLETIFKGAVGKIPTEIILKVIDVKKGIIRLEVKAKEE